MTEDPKDTKPTTDENLKKDDSPAAKGKSGELPESQLDEISGGSGDPCEGGQLR